MTKFSLSISDLCVENNKKCHKLKKTSFWVLLIGLVVGSLFCYLGQVNSIASKGFVLRDLEREAQSLKAENEKLAVNLVEMRSMNSLKDRVENLGMVSVGQIIYLDGGETVVVRR